MCAPPLQNKHTLFILAREYVAMMWKKKMLMWPAEQIINVFKLKYYWLKNDNEKSAHWFSSPSLFVCFRFRTIRLLVWWKEKRKVVRVHVLLHSWIRLCILIDLMHVGSGMEGLWYGLNLKINHSIEWHFDGVVN